MSEVMTHVTNEVADTHLSEVQSNYIPVISAEDEQLIKQLAPSSTFLPRVTLIQNMSKEASGRDAKFRSGNLVLFTGKEGELLGDSFDFFAYSYRHKAVEITTDESFTYYKPGTPDFERIRGIASEPGMNGCLYGIEFLIYITSLGKFATFYFSNTTLKNCVEAVVGMMKTGRHIKCKNDYIEGPKFSWWGAKFNPNPVAAQFRPSVEEIEAQVKIFKEAKDSEIKKVETNAAGATDRVR